MMGRITLVVDPSQAAMDEPEIAIRFHDALTIERRVPRATGSPERPMSAEAVEAKFAILAGMALPPDTVGAIAALIAGLDKADDVEPLLRHLSTGTLALTPFC